MKFKISRSELLDNVLFVSKTTTAKSTIMALSGVMIEAGEKLNIYSTDLETSIKVDFKMKIIEKGRVVVSAKILLNILKSFPEAKIELELINTTNQLRVACQNATFNLNTFSIEDYPKFPKINKENNFSLSLKKFKNTILKVGKSVSIDESRTILTGVLIEANNNSLKIVATDSYRLSFIEEKMDFKGKPFKIVVPYKALDNLLKSEFIDDEVKVNVEENQISFDLEKGKNINTTIISRLLSGKFPEYEKLIPSKIKHNIIINREEILEVVRRISSISQDNIPIKLDIYDGKIMMSMNIREVGSSSEDLGVAYQQERIEVAFNPKFLIDGIETIRDENMIFCINGPLEPVLLKPEKTEGLIYLLMPVRIS